LDPALTLTSVIDNLFLRSSLAFKWIADELALDETNQGKRKTAGTPKSKGQRGRPVDTDPTEDRRIADAWATGSYRTYEECARKLGLGDRGKHIVEAALDRERKRRKKSGR
jgi:hypothetical protein